MIKIDKDFLVCYGLVKEQKEQKCYASEKSLQNHEKLKGRDYSE